MCWCTVKATVFFPNQKIKSNKRTCSLLLLAKHAECFVLCQMVWNSQLSYVLCCVRGQTCLQGVQDLRTLSTFTHK